MNEDLYHTYLTKSEVINKYFEELRKEVSGLLNLDSLLRFSISEKRNNIIEEFLRLGLDPNYRLTTKDLSEPSYTCLMYYCDSTENLKMVKLLIDKGADINIINEEGKTALFYASQNGYLKIVKLLLDKGAEINIEDKKGETPLTISYVNFNFEVSELLLKRGAKVSYDGYGEPNFYSYFITYNEKEKIQELIRKYEFLNKKGAKRD